MLNLEEEFDKSWQEESRRHAAITIRNEVNDWCGPKRPTAEKRWLWELLQNGIDTAKEHDVAALSISIESKNGNLVARHNGGTFQLNEIIALVSGGTSKYFGRETLGKFGKGFLVTHVVSKQVDVEGLIIHAGVTGSFKIGMNRDGDESKIEHNINDCKKQLSKTSYDATAIKNTETIFTYLDADEKAASCCKELSKALPYIMTFNPRISKLTIDLGQENFQRLWQREENRSFTHNGRILHETVITTSVGKTTCIKIEDKGLELAIQLADSNGQKKVVDTRYSPCLYANNLPLYDSDAIGVSYAINSEEFSIDTDRSFVNPTSDNSSILIKLADLLASLIDYLISIDAQNLHLLGHADFSRIIDEKRKSLLKDSFSFIPNAICSKQIVLCKSANVDPSSAHIPLGNYLEQYIPNLTPQIHSLLTQCYLNVPELYSEWEQIAKEWTMLGMSLQTHTLEDLLENLPQDLPKIQHESKKTYATSLIKALILAQQITKSIPKEITSRRILLNQKLELVAPQDANIDLDVDGKLKDIASAVGWDIKSQLLDTDQLQEDSVKGFISNTLCAGRDAFTNDLVLKKLWESHISTKWKENQNQPEYKKALLELVAWLVLNKDSKELRDFVNPDFLPILCEDDKFRSSDEVQLYPFLWPRAKWKDDLKEFSILFGSRWVMSADYLTILEQDKQEKFLEALAFVSVAVQDPDFTWTEQQLNEKEANSVASSGKFPTGVKVDSCADLIGLQDMTSAVAGAKDLAQASKVLEFILTYVINQDRSWASPINLQRGSVYPCYWLSVLKTKDWVPSIDGRHLEPLNSENLERLLLGIPNLKLTEDIVDFLGKHFEINMPGILALKLKTMSPSDNRVALLDKLIALPIDDAQKIADKVEDSLRIIRTVRRNQKVGRIIENIAKEIFEKEGFKTKWTGIGSDFKLLESDDIGSISLQREGSKEDSGIFIEVKAASTDMVRLTLEQSRKAVQQKARYILCVADVSAFDFSVDSEQEASDSLMESLRDSLKFVIEIGQQIESAVTEAESLQDHQVELKDTEISPGISLRFEEAQIRLGVMKQIWEAGCGLEHTVSYCKNMLSKPA